jgi:hypothetical protein
VPPWAIAAAGSGAAVRVVAREYPNEMSQGRGMPFLLQKDKQGRFELCANAPSMFAVWLERAEGRERISAETELSFEHPGAQDPIAFRELAGKKVTLQFVNVPDHGDLEVRAVGGKSSNPSNTIACSGAAFSREFTLAEGERFQLSLRMSSKPSEKSGWTRLVPVQDEREITIDLGGCERRVRLEASELDLKVGEGSIGFLRCENGEASLEQSIVVLCEAGHGLTPVHIPNGRWLYRYDDKNQIAVWGVVDVTTATQPGEELVLRPGLRLAPIAELQPGIRFDEIEGISLAKLPEEFRIASAKGSAERVALPQNAKYATLEGK